MKTPTYIDFAKRFRRSREVVFRRIDVDVHGKSIMKLIYIYTLLVATFFWIWHQFPLDGDTCILQLYL